MRLAQQTIGLATLRRARLAAEYADQVDLALLDDATRFLAPEKVRETTDCERALLLQCRDAFHGQIDILNAEMAGFRDDIAAALATQAISKQRDSHLALAESRYVENLQKQGLTPRALRVNGFRQIKLWCFGSPTSGLRSGIVLAAAPCGR